MYQKQRCSYTTRCIYDAYETYICNGFNFFSDIALLSRPRSGRARALWLSCRASRGCEKALVVWDLGDLGEVELVLYKWKFQAKAEPFRHAFGTTGHWCLIVTDRRELLWNHEGQEVLLRYADFCCFWVVTPYSVAAEAPNERSDCYVTPMQHSCSSHHASCTVAAFAWIHPCITHTCVLLHMPTLSCGTCSWSHLATCTWTLWWIGSISIVLVALLDSITHSFLT